MSFEQLLGKISSIALRDVALHWNDVRGTRRMPGWSDIKPEAIARHLHLVWAWKYDAENDDFIGRLAGEQIVQAFGESPRGKSGREFFKHRGGDAMFARARRIVTEPCMFYGRGSVFAHVGRIVEGERIILPLAEDGVTGDGIFGATIYNSPEPYTEGPDYLSSERGEFILL